MNSSLNWTETKKMEPTEEEGSWGMKHQRVQLSLIFQNLVTECKELVRKLSKWEKQKRRIWEHRGRVEVVFLNA